TSRWTPVYLTTGGLSVRAGGSMQNVHTHCRGQTSSRQTRMDRIEISKVTSADISRLQAICRQTFAETFAAYNTSDDMQMYFDNNLSTDKLKDELSDPNSEFYFALLDNKAIGYLKIN